MPRQNIIVLGGAGFIGSHTCKLLENADFKPIIVDNFSKGHLSLCSNFHAENLDVLETASLAEVFVKYQPKAVIHFAALTEVNDSFKSPDLYFSNNVEGTRSILTAMHKTGLKNLVFSSTAAVYGTPQTFAPVRETHPLSPISPYGASKIAAEELIRYCEAAYDIRSVTLRYFNAAGADESAGIGESHFPESHLIPLTIQTALGFRSHISLYGQDYDTEDGTCIRDYVHVSDLAEAHLCAVKYLLDGGKTAIFNLGSGTGRSVQEIFDMVSALTGIKLNVLNSDRRAGDPAYLVADISKAFDQLNWKPKRDLADIIRTAYNWHNSDTYRQLLLEHQKAS